MIAFTSENGKWCEVNRSNACPICKRKKYCCVNGEWTACRWENKGGREKQDKNGATFYLHGPFGEGGERWPEPTYEMLPMAPPG